MNIKTKEKSCCRFPECFIKERKKLKNTLNVFLSTSQVWYQNISFKFLRSSSHVTSLRKIHINILILKFLLFRNHTSQSIVPQKRSCIHCQKLYFLCFRWMNWEKINRLIYRKHNYICNDIFFLFITAK